MKLGNLKSALKFYVAGVLMIHLLVIWNARDLIWKGYSDFTIYYTAGTIVREGSGHKLYDDATQFEVQQQFAPQVATRLAALPFNHPAFEALLFVPFSYLSYRPAFLFWTLMNLAMLATLPIMLRPFVPVLACGAAWAWSIGSLAFFPIFFALLQGQDAILLMFIYALAFVSMMKERPFSAGCWLACGLFKFHLVLPFLLLLLMQRDKAHSRTRILWGFLLVAVVLGAVSIGLVGTQQIVFYPRYVLGLEKTMALGAIMPSDMPNLRGILYLIAAKLQHFEILVVLLSGLIFVLTAGVCRFSKNNSDLKFSLAVIATVLVSYHGLGYDLCVLVLPMLLIAGQVPQNIRPTTWTGAAIIAGMTLLLFSPLQLVLLMKYNRLALLGWALVLCFLGLLGELSLGSSRPKVRIMIPATISQGPR